MNKSIPYQLIIIRKLICHAPPNKRYDQMSPLWDTSSSPPLVIGVVVVGDRMVVGFTITYAISTYDH
jgi:hypothetical protein